VLQRIAAGIPAAGLAERFLAKRLIGALVQLSVLILGPVWPRIQNARTATRAYRLDLFIVDATVVHYYTSPQVIRCGQGDLMTGLLKPSTNATINQLVWGIDVCICHPAMNNHQLLGLHEQCAYAPWEVWLEMARTEQATEISTSCRHVQQQSGVAPPVGKQTKRLLQQARHSGCVGTPSALRSRTSSVDVATPSSYDTCSASPLLPYHTATGSTATALCMIVRSVQSQPSSRLRLFGSEATCSSSYDI
jgi:hypothetical protein